MCLTSIILFSIILIYNARDNEGVNRHCQREPNAMKDLENKSESPREIVRSANSVPRQEVTAGSATQTQVLLDAQDGAPHFAMRRFVMGEGGGMPRHTNSVEHEQYVLRGQAKVGIGNRIYQVRPDDVLYIPAGIPHFYEVTEAPFEFLCLVPNQPDRLEILEEGCRPGGLKS